MSWQHYCTASSSGRQPNFVALNRRRHLCSAGRPSGWAMAHILVVLSPWFLLQNKWRKKSELETGEFRCIWKAAVKVEMAVWTARQLVRVHGSVVIRFETFYFHKNAYRNLHFVTFLGGMFIMVVVWNRADHYIFILWVLLLLLSIFFPRLISAVADWMSTILPHMAWP